MLENYHLYRLENKFEPIFLSVITFMEMINLQPYSNNNEIASVLSLYYMMLLSEVYAFEYISFMELYFTFRKDIEEAVAKEVSIILQIIYKQVIQLDLFLNLLEKLIIN